MELVYLFTGVVIGCMVAKRGRRLGLKITRENSLVSLVLLFAIFVVFGLILVLKV